jgi:type IV conjugative transfer system protein TraE
MEFKKYLDENVNLVRQLRFLRFVVFLLAAAVVINGFFVYSSDIRHKTILIPPLIEGEAYVYGKDASDSYLKAMAEHTCFTRLNYTPTNVGKQFSAFLKLLDSSAYSVHSSALYKQKENIIQMQVSSAFFPEQVKIDRNKKIIYVSGHLSQWTYDKEFITSERRTYAVKYQINSGRFYVTDFIGCGKSISDCEGKTDEGEVKNE